MALRVLGFMAHPDDVEFTCAGTLIRLKKEAGCEIAIATATSGDCGTTQYNNADIARIRYNEAKTSAALLGAKYFNAACRDMFVMYDDPTLRRFIEILRKAQPDIVITQPPVDYMVDHENTGKLVRSACFGAPIPNVFTFDPEPAPVLGKIPHLYYCDPPEDKEIFGEPVEPQFVVDITSSIELKTEMLACHVSQREWLRAHHGMDEYVESMKRRAANRAKLIGKPYGEGFRQHLGHGYPQNNIIAELLKMSC
jgi:LmbE family N-acetylglucosaminyl deacetylase